MKKHKKIHPTQPQDTETGRVSTIHNQPNSRSTYRGIEPSIAGVARR